MNWLSQIFGFFKQFQFWVVIAPWEAGLRVRLGSNSVVLPPGPHLRLPFVDRIFVLPTRLRPISQTGQTITTLDGYTLTVDLTVLYQIQDIKQVFDTMSNPEYVLLSRIQGMITDYVSQKTKKELDARTVEAQVTQSAKAIGLGLSGVQLYITGWAFCRTYRLMNNGYLNLSKTNNLEE